MAGFRYRGKSTDDIIGTPLLLVSYESDGIFGSARSKLESDITISRPVTNEYGVIYDSLSFSYALIKSNYEPYTEEEQVTVERWLTSPKLSSELTIINCEDGEYSYFGLFTETNWDRANGGFIICGFTFQVNGAYPYRHITKTVWNPLEYDMNEPPNITNVKDGGDFSVNCNSDELEEYVYPTIIISPATKDYDSSFSLSANSDPDGGYISTNTSVKIPIYLDCKRCRAYTMVDDILIMNLKFKDLNWSDVDNIYWPRLIPGQNDFHVDGHVSIIFDYYEPYKKVGGWLV